MYVCFCMFYSILKMVSPTYSMQIDTCAEPL